MYNLKGRLVILGIVWLWTSLMMAQSPAPGTVSFERRDVDLSSVPRDLGLGDFNGDGAPDLAVITPDRVLIFLGNGDGTFRAAESLALDRSPIAIAVGDFNGDSLSDLAVIAFPFVLIRLSNGDGTFRPAPSLTINGTYPYAFVQAADLNSDGLTDLVFTGSSPIHPGGRPFFMIYLSQGDGRFEYRSSSELSTGPYVPHVMVGDFNGDGIPDLAVVLDGPSRLFILPGQGDGSVGFPRESISLPPQSNVLTTGDFNGDNYLDLAVASTTLNTLSILLGNGDGTFGSVQHYLVETGPSAIAVADFNGDGYADLAVTFQGSCCPYSAGVVAVWLSNGDGTFAVAQNFGVGTLPTSILAADFNQDNGPDLALINRGSNTASILMNTTPARGRIRPEADGR